MGIGKFVVKLVGFRVDTNYFLRFVLISKTVLSVCKSMSIFCDIGLLAINSLTSCLSGNAFILT